MILAINTAVLKRAASLFDGRSDVPDAFRGVLIDITDAGDPVVVVTDKVTLYAALPWFSGTSHSKSCRATWFLPVEAVQKIPDKPATILEQKSGEGLFVGDKQLASTELPPPELRKWRPVAQGAVNTSSQVDKQLVFNSGVLTRMMGMTRSDRGQACVSFHPNLSSYGCILHFSNPDVKAGVVISMPLNDKYLDKQEYASLTDTGLGWLRHLYTERKA